MIYRTCRARRHTRIATVADRWVNHIVSIIMRDRINRTGLLTGIASYANLGINQVLTYQHLNIICAHSLSSVDLVGLVGLVKANVVKINRLAIDTDWRRCNPISHLARLNHTPHQ